MWEIGANSPDILIKRAMGFLLRHPACKIRVGDHEQLAKLVSLHHRHHDFGADILSGRLRTGEDFTNVPWNKEFELIFFEDGEVMAAHVKFACFTDTHLDQHSKTVDIDFVAEVICIADGMISDALVPLRIAAVAERVR